MKDSFFDEYVDPNSDNQETNDNYAENTGSKWNEILTILERVLSQMPQTTE